MSLLWAFMLFLAPAARAQIRNPDAFIYAITGDIDSLDPDWEFDAISQEAQFQLYETLIFFKGVAVDEYEPLLATAVPTRDNGLISPDGLRYAFPLRKNARFHDGTLMTPEDVRYSFMRCLLMDRASGSSYLTLDPLLGVQTAAGKDGKPDPEVYRRAAEAIKIEGGALVLRLPKPYEPLMSILASFCPVVSKDFLVKNGDWDGRLETWAEHYNPPKQATALYAQANGTGPFQLTRWDKENKQLVLARNEHYWRKPARLAQLVFKTVTDANTRKLMLAAGDADALMMERQYLPTVAALPGVAVLDDLPLLETHNVFVMNFKINPAANPYIGSGRLDGDGIPPDFFADIDVRKGFAHAFDYDAYIRDGYKGKGTRSRGPIPRGLFGYNERQAVYEYDPAKSAQYFQKAFGGRLWEKGFHFTLAFMEGRADRQLACQILKKNIEALNPKFAIDVRPVLWSTLLAASQAHQVPIMNARWQMDFPDPHNLVFTFLHSDGYYASLQGYSNPRADRNIDLAKWEGDRDKRRALYFELQALSYADIPTIYTIDTFHFQVLRSWVKGWYYNPIALYGYLYPVYKEEP